MSKNHYLELEKDDILFVINDDYEGIFIFDGTDIKRLVTADKLKVTEEIHDYAGTQDWEIIN